MYTTNAETGSHNEQTLDSPCFGMQRKITLSRGNFSRVGRVWGNINNFNLGLIVTLSIHSSSLPCCIAFCCSVAKKANATL